MIKLVAAVSLLAFVAGCAGTPQHWNRGHGESVKIYPYTPGSANRAQAEGEACWLESNRVNWDECY
jgi:hypothetical protein|tara:strand:- start:88 stop:285 length:198 start_codon:yes stop_codon:yes gene_type:complete